MNLWRFSPQFSDIWPSIASFFWLWLRSNCVLYSTFIEILKYIQHELKVSEAYFFLFFDTCNLKLSLNSFEAKILGRLLLKWSTNDRSKGQPTVE